MENWNGKNVSTLEKNKEVGVVFFFEKATLFNLNSPPKKKKGRLLSFFGKCNTIQQIIPNQSGY